MLFKTLQKLKDKTGLTEDIKGKIDVFFAVGRITEEQYNELMGIETETEENSASETEDYSYTDTSLY